MVVCQYKINVNSKITEQPELVCSRIFNPKNYNGVTLCLVYCQTKVILIFITWYIKGANISFEALPLNTSSALPEYRSVMMTFICYKYKQLFAKEDRRLF